MRILFLLFLMLLAGTNPLFAQEAIVSQDGFTLDDCIAEALANHPQMSIYEQKLRQKKSRLSAVIAENLPQVDATASYDRLSYVTSLKKRNLGNSNNDYQADLVVTQPLFTGGKILAQWRSARYAVDAAEQGFFATKEDVIYNVKAAYYKLAFARDILQSKEELLKYAELSYDTALDLHKRTKIPREETLLRLAVQVDEIRQELITAQIGLRIEQKSLLNSMGRDSSGTIEIRELKDDQSFPVDMPIDISQNPIILKTATEVKEAEQYIKIARSDFFPQIRAHYNYGYEWSSLPDGHSDWTAGVAIDFNIWGWGKTKASVNEAKAYRSEIRSYEDLLTQQMDLALESARLKYESASQRFKIAKKSLEQARRSLDLFDSRYRDALATSLELLDAQKAFSVAQVNYAMSILDMRLAKSEIEKVAGKGYDLK